MKIPFNTVPLKIRIRLVKGVLRRWSLTHFNKSYVRKQMETRKGECKRCSVCCQLSTPCPALKWGGDEYSECKIYKYYRPPNCCNFPIDERDLADRDLLSSDTKCGYHW
ncbi:MAG: hypothetical protein PF904_09940 [Kiritimatiellae bacterium]|nr:hypothetical protein [Kiritimatiellia bacterium]